MSLFSRKIHVTLIDAKNNEIIAKSKVPADSLPESFGPDTTLHIGNEGWCVVAAEPRDRAAYKKTRTLTLRLVKIEWANPRDILFSLPSISSEIPGPGSEPVVASDVVLHEDDWRQMELVSRANAAAIERQFAAIRRIHEEQSVEGGGWRELHKRTEPSPAITNAFRMEDIQRAFDAEGQLGGVTFEKWPNRIADGFSVRGKDGLCLYGLAPAGRIDTLGIVDSPAELTPDDSIAALVELASKFDLDLVHWCRCQREAPSVPGFRSILMWGFGENAE